MPGLRGAAIVDFSAMALAFSSIKIPGVIPGSSSFTGNIEPLVTIGSRGNLTQGRRARELGFTIDDVRTLLGLADLSADTCTEAETIARAQLDQIRHKIADLKVLEGRLQAMAALCADGTIPTSPDIAAFCRCKR